MASVYEAALEGDIDALRAFEPSLILDAIWLADIESSNRSVLANTLSNLLSAQKIPADLARQRLDFELLEAAQAINDASAWNKRQIRINTAQLYKQQRFNLWREESEGYARLLVALNQMSSWSSIEHAFEELLRLIGIFDIDPNRVVDLIFDTAATRADPSYIDLIKRFDFPPSTVSAIVGMKLGGLGENNLPDEYIEGLFLAIALAIQAEIFELEDILPYLLQEATQKAEEKEASSAMDSLTAHDTGRSIPVDSSQLLWLCASLLRVNAVDTFEAAMTLIQGNTWSTILSSTICVYIRALLGYHDSTLLVHPKPDSSIDTVCYWLAKLGPTGLYHDHQLIALLIRECDINDLRWISLLVQFILPSLSISYGNPYLSNLLWSKLDSLHYTTRFEIYTRWRSVDHPHVSKATSFAKNDLRRLLRRLSKENVKQYGRLLGKLVHSNPTIIFPLLLEQCQAYDNLIPPIIESCRYLTPLAYDVLTFSLLQQLKKQQEHMKDDATFVASWLQRMASFIGQLARRYAVDLLPIMDYLNDRMLDNRAVEVCILEELLAKLGGIESRWEVSDAQVEALIGGPALKAEVSPRNRKLTAKLNPLVSLDTWLLLGYQRTISEDLDEDVLKLASTLFDQATSCFLQFSEYVGSCPEVVLLDPREHEVWSSLSIDSQMTIWRTWIRRRHDFNVGTLSGWREVFWGLDLGDVHVPIGRYQSEIARLKTLLITAESKRDRERVPAVVSALEGELRSRIQHAQAIATQLTTSLVIDAPISAFLQDAIYPRCVMSSADATYCAKFTTSLHPQVNTFTVLNELTDLLPTILIACTEREARYFGKYYAELLLPIDSWHRDVSKFIAEARIKKEDDQDALIDYEEFRHLLFALHGKVVAACGGCIEAEGEFLRLRSSIIFLSVLTSASVFPRVDSHARTLLKAIKGLKRGDAREDVKVMSVRMEASLKSVSVVREAEFHFVMDTFSDVEFKDELRVDEGEAVESLGGVEESVEQRVQMMDLEDGERESELVKTPEASTSSIPVEATRHDSLTLQSKESSSQRIVSQPSSPKESKKRSREPTPTRSDRKPKRREAQGVPSQQHAASPRENLDRPPRSAIQVDSRAPARQHSERMRGTEQVSRSRVRSNEAPPVPQQQQYQQYSPRPRDSRTDYPRDQYPPPNSVPPPRHVEVTMHEHQSQQQQHYEPSPRDLSRDWRDLRASETLRDRRDGEKKRQRGDSRGQHQSSGGRYAPNRHNDDGRNY